MPSPFPGMEPYLEGDLWTSFHALFVSEIIRLLTPQLRPRYIALAQKYHIVVDNPGTTGFSPRSVYPDVGITPIANDSGNAVAGTLTAPLLLETVMPEQIPHPWIKILDTRNRQWVTAIEFLSPANKIGKGRRKYLRKRASLLRSPVHLLEIDLIRVGKRVPMREPLPKVPYFVFLGRAEKRPLTEIWPIRLEESLPTVPLPLSKGDADIEVALQTAFSGSFDLSGFDMMIDYRQPPTANLSAEEKNWMDSRLKEVGARS